MARYVLDGRIAVVFMTTIPATPLAPTQAELSAGVNLIGTSQDEALENIEGFVVEPNIIPTPDYASTQVGTVTGDQSYPQSTLSFYADDTVTTIFSALVDGTTGFVAFMYDGQAAASAVDVFPITVSSRVRRPARNAAHIFDVNCAPGVPYLNGTQAA